MRAWAASPVVVLEGPRAVGKTTLAQALVLPGRFHSLASSDELAVAEQSPLAWVASMPIGSAIDEAQLIPGLSLIVKGHVDRPGAPPGQLLLTGSVRIARDELGGSDPLVGRVRRFTLLPFTQCEMDGSPRDVVTELFDGDPSTWFMEPVAQPEMFRRISMGGFPGFRTIVDAADRKAQLDEYLKGLFAGELRKPTTTRESILGLFRWLAAQSGAIQNVTKFATANEHRAETIKDHLGQLADMFLTDSVPAWRPGPGKQETSAPRLFVVDPAFTASATNLDAHTAVARPEHGPAFETFVANELRRLLGWSSVRAELFHWRRGDRYEVDLVLEDPATGRLVAVEVKAARESNANFFRGINALKKAYPDRFHRGFVVHCGDHPLRHGDDLWFLPFSALWSIGPIVNSFAFVQPERTLSNALGAALTAITKTSGFVNGAELSRWVQKLNSDMTTVVLPQLELVGASLRNLGFTAISDGGQPMTASTTPTPRDNSTIGSCTARLEITDNRKPVQTNGWSLEVLAELRSNGIVSWALTDRYPQEVHEFGGPFDVGWDQDPDPAIEEHLVRFADLLPHLVGMWPNVRRMP